jgi:hypothetical protein
MCYQLNLFEEIKNGTIDYKPMIKKSGVCKYCNSLLRVRPKYLDKRLGELAIDIYKSRKKTFRGDDIWQDRKKIADFQKLKYFGIIKKFGHCRWELTYTGIRFIEGKARLPDRVFVLNNRVIDDSDKWIDIFRLNDRWQKEYSDYAKDYFPKLNFDAQVA